MSSFEETDTETQPLEPSQLPKSSLSPTLWGGTFQPDLRDLLPEFKDAIESIIHSSDSDSGSEDKKSSSSKRGTLFRVQDRPWKYPPSISYHYFDTCFFTYRAFLTEEIPVQSYALVASNGMGFTSYGLYKALSKQLYLVQADLNTIRHVYEVYPEYMEGMAMP